MQPARILGVGVATLDLVNEVSDYPAEDSEVRALGQWVRRGGNVTNTLSVFAQLGHCCTWAGTLGDDAWSEEILRDLERRGIDTGPSVRYPGRRTPTSCVTISRATGSRSIVHFRDLPELRAVDLTRLDPGGLDWVHFEGRNPEETALMLRELRARRPELPISLELEKPRPGIEHLLVGPHVLLLARTYARSLGYSDPVRFLSEQWAGTDAQLLILPWGADGAYGQARGGTVFFAPASDPAQVVDTLGAGDVFNAAAIDGILAGLDLSALLTRANRLAGHKCGRHGLDGLVANARERGFA